MLAATAGRQVNWARGKGVPQAGWASIKNGELLKRADDTFEVFVTADRNLSFQQNLTRRKVVVVVLPASSNRLEDLLPLIPKILIALTTIKNGQLVEVGI